MKPIGSRPKSTSKKKKKKENQRKKMRHFPTRTTTTNDLFYCSIYKAIYSRAHTGNFSQSQCYHIISLSLQPVSNDYNRNVTVENYLKSSHVEGLSNGINRLSKCYFYQL